MKKPRSALILTRCEDAQEALWARIGTEHAGLPPASLDAHLARCPRCRALEAAITALGREARIRPVRQPPPQLVNRLRQVRKEWDPLEPPRRRFRTSPTPVLRWVAAAVPVVVLSVSLMFGPLRSAPRPPAVRPVLCPSARGQW